MPTIIRAESPADFLALVPELLGFEPRNSVVLVAFHGNRTSGALRFALPTAPAVYKRAASQVIGTMCKLPDIQAIAVVVYTDAGFDEMVTPPHAEFVRVLQRRIEHAGFGLHDALCRASDGWGSYLRGAAPGGNPLEQLREAAAIDLPGGSRVRDYEQPARIPDADDGTRDQVRQVLAAYRMLVSRTPQDGLIEQFDAFHDFPLFAEAALFWDPEQVREKGPVLLFCVQSPPLRDQVMMQWATDLGTGDRIHDSNFRSRTDPSLFDASLADIMLGIGPRPDPERVHTAIALLEMLVSWADDPERRAPLCMLAWLNWALGRSTIAAGHIAEARRIDPGYGMAELLDAIVERGMLPEWAFGE